MRQSRKDAWLEQFVRVGIGFVTNYPLNCFLLTAFGLKSDHASMGLMSLYITLAFTVWALIRGYMVRRWFDYKAAKPNRKSTVNVKAHQIGFLTNRAEVMNFNQDGFALD